MSAAIHAACDAGYAPGPSLPTRHPHWVLAATILAKVEYLNPGDDPRNG